MKAETIYNKFLKTAKYLLKELDYYGENQFKRRIDEKSWTLGEFYDFLLNSSLNYYIPEINRCLDPSTGNQESKKNAKGKFVFWYGRFPAVFKYQEVTKYQPVQPENPDKAKDSFYRFIKIMAKTAQEIDNSSVTCKSLHPLYGMLDAKEWYQIIEMNFRYHLKTKFELDKVIRNSIVEEDDLPDFAAVREARGMQVVNDLEDID